MKPVKFSINDCSCDKVERLCLKLGFKIYEGKKHKKVKNNKNEFVTLIPRGTHLKRPLVEGIIKALIKNGAVIIYK